MITIRPAEMRGHRNFGWLDTFHTFSFGDYHDPAHMGFRSLRVINEDRVRPGTGFGKHPHRDMEIITVIVSGALAHRDSMGNGSVLVPGDVQYMSAGTGVTHSEINPSPSEDVHLLQIWIEPATLALPPRYEQRRFPEMEDGVLASPEGRDGSIIIRQDAVLSAAVVNRGRHLLLPPATSRALWVQMIEGRAALNGHGIKAGDGVAITGENGLRLEAEEDARLLVFDLA
jgi:redox-sensitive bicupin YhaK (pirin superfamily)